MCSLWGYSDRPSQPFCSGACTSDRCTTCCARPTASDCSTLSAPACCLEDPRRAQAGRGPSCRCHAGNSSQVAVSCVSLAAVQQTTVGMPVCCSSCCDVSGKISSCACVRAAALPGSHSRQRHTGPRSRRTLRMCLPSALSSAVALCPPSSSSLPLACASAPPVPTPSSCWNSVDRNKFFAQC